MAVNYGLNKVRFPAPVPVGSRLRGTFRVDERRRGRVGLPGGDDGDGRARGRRQAGLRRRGALPLLPVNGRPFSSPAPRAASARRSRSACGRTAGRCTPSTSRTAISRRARATAPSSTRRSSASTAGSTPSSRTPASSTSRRCATSRRSSGTSFRRCSLTSPFLLAKYAWDALAASGDGRFLAVASVHGLVASPFKAGYVAAKHGVLGLVKVLALEGAEAGISASAICPAYVRTAIVEGQLVDRSEDGPARARRRSSACSSRPRWLPQRPGSLGRTADP